MTTVLDTYLGWELLAHRPTCKRPEWVVDVRDDDYQFRDRDVGEPPHSCPHEDCNHANRFVETTVRIVCSSCGSVHLIRGEQTRRTDTSTTYLGYGQEPRKAAGLYLWPGEPWLNFGRAVSAEPHDFVVTRRKVARVTEADVFGMITQGRGKRGAVRWAALAVPDPDGQYGYGSPVRFSRLSEEHRTVAAAAKWITAQLGEKDTRTAGDVHSADEVTGGTGE